MRELPFCRLDAEVGEIGDVAPGDMLSRDWRSCSQRFRERREVWGCGMAERLMEDHGESGECRARSTAMMKLSKAILCLGYGIMRINAIGRQTWQPIPEST